MSALSDKVCTNPAPCDYKLIDEAKADTVDNRIKSKNYDWEENDEFQYYTIDVFASGYVEEVWSYQRCNTPIIVPGTSLMNDGLMGFVYLLWLGYLFVGIAIISDIFMESIESITSQTVKVDYWDKDKTTHVT